MASRSPEHHLGQLSQTAENTNSLTDVLGIPLMLLVGGKSKALSCADDFYSRYQLNLE